MSGDGNQRGWIPLLEISPEEEERTHTFFSESSDEDFEPEVDDDQSDFDDETANDPSYVPNYDDFVDAEPPEELYEDEDEVEVAVDPNRGQKYTSQGKGDKTVWWSMPTESEKERTERSKANRKQSFAYCKDNFDDKMKAFQRVFPPAIVGQIVIETNRKAKRAYAENRRRNSPKKIRYWRDTNVDEIYAYIAILLYSGAEKSHSVDTSELFDSSNMPFYRAVMSGSRFEQLTRFLRFDDSRTRMARLREDKLAPIRYIWDLFQKNLNAAYVPSLELVADEQLLKTRNRCSFRQYIPSKPGKYGIKIFWLVDSKTNYPLAAEVYLGQQPNLNSSKGIAHDLVLRLMKDYLYLGANLTIDNFFVSYELAMDLLEKNTTITGTIRSNKRELPKVFASASEAKKRGPRQTVFCFSKSCELLSYTSNTCKNVLLLSTAHATEKIDEETGKPLVILDYNENKGGVDTFDKMLRCYTCVRKCNRWPMLVFHNMIDVAALAAYRLCELSNPTWKAGRRDKRKIFLKELAYDLAQNNLENRCQLPLFESTKIAMNLIKFKPKNVREIPRKMPLIQVKSQVIISLSRSVLSMCIIIYNLR